jgi:hypothetical protein
MCDTSHKQVKLIKEQEETILGLEKKLALASSETNSLEAENPADKRNCSCKI